MKKIIIFCSLLIVGCGNEIEKPVSYVGKSINEYTVYAAKNDIDYDIIYVDSNKPYGEIISDIKPLKVSNGSLLFKNNKVDELGRIPVMMYHGIVNEASAYIGGNIDSSGYNRSLEAFKKDLEFYYNSGYRAIRLVDYVNGIIDVELGKSPIILTFDDGNSNNFRVTGIENDKLIIDPNSAVGIMENFKKSHPDFKITATFFLHNSLFFQNKYSKEMLNWLVENGYDIGNHTYSHIDLSSIDGATVKEDVNKMYSLLEENIGKKYVNIVSLPFGQPYSKSHPNFEAILQSSISTLRVGWEANYSPFSNSFDKTFIKRIRAYDNNGMENDIEAEFKKLGTSRFISDGNKDIITIKKSDMGLLNKKENIIMYEE